VKPVIIIAIAIGCLVIGFFIYQEMNRQIILVETKIGFEKCNRNVQGNLMNPDKVEEYAECIKNLSDTLREFNERTLGFQQFTGEVDYSEREIDVSRILKACEKYEPGSLEFGKCIRENNP